MRFDFLEKDLAENDPEGIIIQLEFLDETIQDRVDYLSQALSDFNKSIELQKGINNVGVNNLLTEKNLERFSRYESYLDRQYYRTLSEFQNITYFLNQRKELTFEEQKS